MCRFVAWFAIFGLGLMLGRFPARSFPAASSDALALREVAERRQNMVECAREDYEGNPNSFLTASRLAVLLSIQREDQQRGEREFGMRISEPVFEPELQALIQHCRRLAHTEAQRNLVHGLARRTSRQDLSKNATG
jgi:hypothetical protein